MLLKLVCSQVNYELATQDDTRGGQMETELGEIIKLE